MKGYIDTKKLERFLTLAQIGNFGRAAKALDISQPTLSNEMRMFEAELGVDLLTRHSRGVTLTRAGATLVQVGGRICRLFAPMREEEDEAREQSRSVVVGVTLGLGRIVAADLYENFRVRFPGQTLELYEADSAELEATVIAGQTDAAIVYDPPNIRELVVEPITSESLVFVYPLTWQLTPPQRPYLLREIARYPLILCRRSHSDHRLLTKVAQKYGVDVTVLLEIDLPSTALHLVHRGIGCTIMSPTSVKDDIAKGRLGMHHISRPELKTQLSVVTSAKSARSKTLYELPRMIRSCVTNVIVN